MKSELRMVHKCEYCGKNYLHKGHCQKHEDICFKNPENDRACFNCIFLKKKDTEVTWENYNGTERSRPVSMFHCEKIDSFIYPPKVEIKGNALDTGENNAPMPKQCEHQRLWPELDATTYLP